MNSPANEEQFLGGRLLPELPVEIHGEEGRARVEDGGQVGHERGQHHGDHDPAHPLGHDAQHELGVGDVGAADGVAAGSHADVGVHATNL